MGGLTLSVSIGCVAPQGAGPDAMGEGSQAPGQPETPAVICDPVPETALAHLADSACGQVLVREDASLDLRALGPGADAPVKSVWRGELPEGCLEWTCSYELVATRLGTAVLVSEAARPPAAIAEQQWLLGPISQVLETPNASELPVPVPLWGGERILIDSTDFGPSYELELWLCGDTAALHLIGREPSADVADAPEPMRALAADASRFGESGSCERVPLPMP